MSAPVSAAELLAGIPPATPVAAEQVGAEAKRSGRVLVVLDDDPTGTQSVHDLPVIMDWSTDSLVWALRQGAPAVYVMTNSRSLDPEHAERCNREVARAAFAAAGRLGVRIAFVSRSDSTLRGHFPLEPDTLADEVSRQRGEEIDGIVIVPAFGDAGRITIDSVHYAGNPVEGYTPVGETEFARDATFGYRASDLREWVEEKTGGRVPASTVARIDIAMLRTDHEATVSLLSSLAHARPVVCDAVDENDLRLLALALYAAESRGSRFVYRVGPPFVRAVIGQEVRPPLRREEIADIRRAAPAEPAPGGLVVVGSHVSMTTQQVECLVTSEHLVQLELDVARVLDDAQGAADRHVAEISRRAVEALAGGTVVVATTRTLVRADDPAASLAIARRVSAALVEVVARVLVARPPRFVVAKGGITSSDVAARGLGIRRAVVRGSLLPGMVSVWEPVEGPARGVPYVVFAGNVGRPDSLAEVVHILSS